HHSFPRKAARAWCCAIISSTSSPNQRGSQHMPSANDTPFKIAAIQAAPVFLDREATVDKACDLIAEAGRNGARIVAFPESFIPTYPDWAWAVPAGESRMLADLYAEFLANAVEVPSQATQKLCQAAKKARTYAVVGISERNTEASAGSMYNTLLY